jgi:flagellar biosynthesis protein FlhF
VPPTAPALPSAGSGPPLAVSRFRGADTTAVFREAGRVLGDDAVVLRTVVHRDAGAGERVEITAATASAVERFRARLSPAPLVSLDRRRVGRAQPLTLAVVGPTGVGKTTTIAKLATAAQPFPDWTVGLLTLDARRTGALEQIHAFAEAAKLPLEVVYGAAEVPGALRRLGRCDVILVDTPGRSRRNATLAAEWDEILRVLAPDEVHLAVPASLRPDLAAHVRADFRTAGVTHALLTKLDEVPGDHGLAELAAELALPLRWVTDGQDVPADLHAGVPRVMAALGAPATVPQPNERAGIAA